MSKDLTLKQRLFVEGYLETRNGVEAARVAGYQGSSNVLSVQAFENLRNPKIQGEIERRLRPFILSANEVLNLLSQQAHGTIESLLDDVGHLDLNKAKENGSIRLIKKLRFHKESGAVESLELHDPQSALVHLGKYHKLFTDKIEVEGMDLDAALERELARVAGADQEAGSSETESESVN